MEIKTKERWETGRNCWAADGGKASPGTARKYVFLFEPCGSLYIPSKKKKDPCRVFSHAFKKSSNFSLDFRFLK